MTPPAELPEHGDAFDFIEAEARDSMDDADIAAQVAALGEAATEYVATVQGKVFPEATAEVPQFADFSPLLRMVTPPLPVDAIPEPMRSLVMEKARSTEAPAELAFVAALGAVAAVVQTRWEVQVKPDYAEQLSIDVAGVAQPGERKTAMINEAIAPLIHWEIGERQRVNEDNAALEIERRVLDGRAKEVEKAATKATDGIERKRLVDEARELVEAMPTLQEARRLFADDATPEQFATLMGKNGGAMAVITDEGGAFMSGLAGRYSAGQAHIDAVLKGWSGSPLRIDRSNGRNVHLDRSFASIAIMVQHELAMKLGENRDFVGRGLLDRFLWLVPTSRLGYRTHDAEPMPQWVSDRWGNALAALLAIPAAPKPDDAETTRPHTIALTPDASQAWLAYTREVETYMRPGHGYYHLRQYCGKWPGQVARLAGVFHCLQHTGDTMPHHAALSVETMQSAIVVARVLLDHADAAFSTMRRSERLDRAMRLWEWVKRQDADTFTGRDAGQSVKQQGAFPDAEAVRDGLGLLMDHGYLSLKREGKSEIYTVNPEARAHHEA